LRKHPDSGGSAPGLETCDRLPRPLRGLRSRRCSMGAAERSAPAGRSDRGLIELSVDAPMDLFNALDPSPLLERDLDEEVETYIVESAHELPHREYHLK